MSGKSINFEAKKINKSKFYKNYFLKKNHMAQKIHLNTSLDTLDIMMMISLDHYV